MNKFEIDKPKTNSNSKMFALQILKRNEREKESPKDFLNHTR